MIRSLVDGQFAEADRALIGRGDFYLRPEWVKHRLTAETWVGMSAAQKKRAADACFKLQSAPSATSTDGTVTVPLTPGGGKKPHQRKRCRTERTKTVAKKPRLMIASDGLCTLVFCIFCCYIVYFMCRKKTKTKRVKVYIVYCMYCIYCTYCISIN